MKLRQNAEVEYETKRETGRSTVREMSYSLTEGDLISVKIPICIALNHFFMELMIVILGTNHKTF